MENFKTGDILLCKSNKPIAKIICAVDKSEYHHCEVVGALHTELVGIGAHPGKSRIDFLTDRIKRQKWTEIHILRPKASFARIEFALQLLCKHSNDYGRYDLPMILRILLYQKFRVDFKSLGIGGSDICSELVQYYMLMLGDKKIGNLPRPFVTPKDIYINSDTDLYEFQK